MFVAFNLDVLGQQEPVKLGQLGKDFLVGGSTREDLINMGDLSAKSLESCGNLGAKVLV